MNEYKFTLLHDNGKSKIKTIANNLDSATQKILNAENCPESAIINIKIKRINEKKI
jgi:hypothetical protein